jgi:hypothetical protein
MKPGLTVAITLTAAVFTGSVLHGQASRAAEAQFKAAQNTEQVEGDRKGAIEQYKKLAQGSDRAIAAKAQARLAALQSPAVAQAGLSRAHPLASSLHNVLHSSDWFLRQARARMLPTGCKVAACTVAPAGAPADGSPWGS